MKIRDVCPKYLQNVKATPGEWLHKVPWYLVNLNLIESKLIYVPIVWAIGLFCYYTLQVSKTYIHTYLCLIMDQKIKRHYWRVVKVFEPILKSTKCQNVDLITKFDNICWSLLPARELDCKRQNKTWTNLHSPSCFFKFFLWILPFAKDWPLKWLLGRL